MNDIESAPRHPEARPEASCGKCRFWLGREGHDTGDCDCDANAWKGSAGQRMRFWTERETACLSWEPKPTKIVRLAGRQCYIIECGEEDGGVIAIEDEVVRQATIEKIMEGKR